VATLTDRFAFEWHSRLVGPVDLRELGLWSSDSRAMVSHAFALPEPIEGL
jgi:dGTPase